MIEMHIERKDPPMNTVPEEHKPLIAKLVHESDKTLQALVKHVHKELLPAHEDDDEDASETITLALTPEAVEKAIQSVAIRNNYGLDNWPGYAKTPAALCIWRWEHPGKSSTKGKERVEGNVIVIDDFDDEETAADVDMRDESLSRCNVSGMTAEDRLRDVLKHMPASLCPSHRRGSPVAHLRSCVPCSVRNIMTQLNEAEVAGDDSQVRSLLSLLRDRTKIPIKVLIFDEDARPGYFGTWTRNSREVGPRAPFARDVLSLDYAYDSGEEWEEENGDADDVVEDAEEDEAGDEEDSDLDSWLVDDDDVEDPGTPIDKRESSPDLFLDVPMPAPPIAKRKASEEKPKRSKKRKVVVPLVPFTKGPCWETNIGDCLYEPFAPYRIHLLDDTPFPIDPFTFVAGSIESVTTSSKDRVTTQDGFVVPALPPRLNAPNIATPSAQAFQPGTKRPLPAPKTAFPEAHLPLLLARINSLATGSLPYIVEAVHQELKEQRVKKNSIEAKIREVGEKCKTKKIWVVKPHFKVR
ncbi:hypothetical protein IEO21_00526 [Rhodonia placenta]|uniref:Chromatin assembly factor 1 subunit A dimerization domain-containing protein n=1 Tax=Rhodonia placenta TaxID=104341 RepID=A0A8H7PBE5_9APHY|nr:hypothetical protein IEO21_00526 [Postia placenta]